MSKAITTTFGDRTMKAFVLALVLGAAMATTATISAHADTFTVHGVWGDSYNGK